MSRYNPFAKPRVAHETVSVAEAPAGGNQVTADSQPQPEQGFRTDVPVAKDVQGDAVPSIPPHLGHSEQGGASVNISPRPAGTHANITSPPILDHTSKPSLIANPTPPRAPTTPLPTSRWRLLWRGGLEVGAQRYRLDGIAFCAKMSFGIPGSLGRLGGGGTPMGGEVQAETPVGSAQASLGKEIAMREEGSYFIGTATQPPSTASPQSPALLSGPTTSRPRRPLLRTQSSTVENTAFTPGGTLTAHAFETSDPDLCLSLESMKGRQTLRVRGVERLSDEEVLDDAGRGDGVHVYLDPGSGDVTSSLSGNAHSVLAQYIFNSICRGKLSAEGRTRKALVVTLGDDVIDASTSATFLIYGQVKQDTQSAAGGRPKLELLATRPKAPPKPEVPRGHAVPKPGEPLPRGKSSFPTDQFPADCPPPSDALYTEDGFKVPTMLSSRTLRRSASAATHAARMSRVKSQSTIYMPPPAAPPVSRHGLSRSHSVMTIDEAGPSKTNPVPPVKKLTPGRRGEKRKRPLKQQLAEEEEKRRRAGKISREGGLGAIAGSPNAAASTSKAPDTIAAKAGAGIPAAGPSSGFPEIISVDDEDIFGNVNRIEDPGANPAAAAKPRSVKKSECETKNKASIKKRLLAAMEARNCGRDHAEFKDVFSVANKGVSFALRHTIAKVPLDKDVVESLVKAHLDLYLPPAEVITVDDDDEDTQTQCVNTARPGTTETRVLAEPVDEIHSIDTHEDDPNTTMI